MGGATDHRLTTQVPSGEPFDLHTTHGFFLREAGLLERPRGGHRGERVFAAKGRVRTLAMRVDD